jgi:hypothetical protein
MCQVVTTPFRGAMIDCGANGGIAGSDTRRISDTGGTVDVVGIDDHELPSISIVSAGAVVSTHLGPAIVILNQYGWYPAGGTSIHSSGQMEHFGNVVDDRSMVVNGRQHVVTMGDYIIPIDIVNGLPYTPMRPYTDEEWDVLPHIIWTSDSDWDPTVLDSKISNKTDWHLATQMPPSDRPSFRQDWYYTDARTWIHLCLTILLTGAETSQVMSPSSST